MTIEFTKMQGLGNDFVVINATKSEFNLSPANIRQLADRHYGVGCDQLLVLEFHDDPDIDFFYRIFNADGNEVGQCGNGARCIARYAERYGLTNKSRIRVATRTGQLDLHLIPQKLVTVTMGVPEFTPGLVPFEAEQRAKHYQLQLAEDAVQLGVVNMGNPHAVITVKQLQDDTVLQWGAALESHARFPEKVNVGFMQVIDKEHIRLRVYERGVGETLACGSGACAAVAVGIDQGVLANRVQVELSGGNLTIQWNGDDTPLTMTGPAEFVFEGRWLAE